MAPKQEIWTVQMRFQHCVGQSCSPYWPVLYANRPGKMKMRLITKSNFFFQKGGSGGNLVFQPLWKADLCCLPGSDVFRYSLRSHFMGYSPRPIALCNKKRKIFCSWKATEFF